MSSKDLSGYVYILQNNSHENLVLKIGLTTGKPEVRAKQLYWGASGVPEHFDIAVAYSVGDCHAAEAEAHRRLKTFRVNPRREFFRIEPKVAQAVVLRACKNINVKLGLFEPEVLNFKNDNFNSYIKPVPSIPEFVGKEFKTGLTEISQLKIAPVDTSKLANEQVDRIEIIYLILSGVHEFTLNEFIDNFSRDKYPEHEIVIWENIAKVYQEFDSITLRNDEERKEAYKFILTSSMLSGDQLSEMIRKCTLSYEDMMAIVSRMKKGGCSKFCVSGSSQL